MSNNIGQRVANVEAEQPWLPISQVKVKKDQSNTYTAGTTTGRTFEVECAIGSQAIADNLLAALNGYVYKAYNATDALIKPNIELGQSVSVGDVYSIVGSIVLKGDMILAADLSAPSSGELDHEYPYDQWRSVMVDAKNIRHGGGHGTVSGEAITDSTVVNKKIAPLAIKSINIEDGAVEEPKMASLSVTARILADEAVGTPKLYDGAVTNTKCSQNVNDSLADADFAGDVFAGDATASWTKVNKIMVTAGGMLDIIGSATFKYGNSTISWKSKVVKDENGDNVTIHYLGF